MARPPSGSDVLDKANELLRHAKSINDLRMAQAVVLPLAFNMNMENTAKAIGISKTWACRLRTSCLRILRGEAQPKGKRGGRWNANLTKEEEVNFLEPFLAMAQDGGILIVPPLKLALEKRLSKQVALSTVYRMLHRHGWRKLAPDKKHPQADAALQMAWKKNSKRK